MRNLADNVWAFMDKAAALVAEHEAQSFGQSMLSDCVDRAESPIEDLFWIACCALCRSQFVPVNPDCPDGRPAYGIYIDAQAKVGAYRVDFLIQQHGIGPAEHLRPVVVELDGHDFHDKDKRQRSYEKARDRFIVKQGYRVLHYTGSDVTKDPFACAFEALELAGVYVASGIAEYDPRDPMNFGV